ncbi:MAG TPA: thiol reductant ABC exporter subunit CydD [Jiangellaceae bacterium]|nr:thiol reductant ABC exporter subunit CydD [Jiangellaceae bacterium]
MNQLARRLVAGLPAARLTAAAFVAMSVAMAVLIIVQADLLAGVLADGVISQSSAAAVAGSLLAIAAVLVARAGLGWAHQVVAQRTAATAKESLRDSVQARTQALGPGWLSGQHAGGIATTVGRGLDALDPYFTGYFPQLFIAAVVPVAVLVRLTVADLASAVIIVITLPLIPIFGILIGLQTQKATRRQWRALERLGGYFLDIVAGLPTLRAFGRARAQAQAVRRTADEHRSATMRTLRVAFISALVLEFVAMMSVALIAVPVGLRLLDGSLDLHTALLVLLLAPEAYLPLRVLGSQFHASTEGLAVAERAFAILDAPGRASRSAPVDIPDQPAEIRFEHVTVRYPGREHPALDDVSLTIGRGERVALVGPSGAGKSTLLGVMLGLVAADHGRVIVAGADGAVDVADLDPDSWRQQVAWVPQRPHLFARSVAANIRLGHSGASDADVRRAARLAHADEFIQALPRGYETELGENGSGLSAGQRQRIALARAFLRDAPVLVLDEPTAGLDAASEAAVVDATARLMAGRTVLVVAHRPAMVTEADRVVRLEHGRVAGARDGRLETGVGAS